MVPLRGRGAVGRAVVPWQVQAGYVTLAMTLVRKLEPRRTRAKRHRSVAVEIRAKRIDRLR
eukprot:3156655-Prymnesium_polylepis.1